MSEAQIIKVEGMGCQSCVAAVTKAVQGVAPAAGVVVDLGAGEVRVSNATLPLSALKAAIEAAGYDVKS